MLWGRRFRGERLWPKKEKNGFCFEETKFVSEYKKERYSLLTVQL